MARKKPEPKYITDADKKRHTKEVVNKAVEIIDRQLDKLSKIPRGRTYIYETEQIEKLEIYLTERITEMIAKLEGDVEGREKFSL